MLMMMMKGTVDVDATTRSRVLASEEEGGQGRKKKGSVLIIRGDRVKETTREFVLQGSRCQQTLKLRKNFEYTILTKQGR
jgi:hypothetical protein